MDPLCNLPALCHWFPFLFFFLSLVCIILKSVSAENSPEFFHVGEISFGWFFVNQFCGCLTESMRRMSARPSHKTFCCCFYLSHQATLKYEILTFRDSQGAAFFPEHTGISLQHAVKSKQFSLPFLYKQEHSSLLPSPQPRFGQSQILFSYSAFANLWPLAEWRIKYIKTW